MAAFAAPDFFKARLIHFGGNRYVVGISFSRCLLGGCGYLARRDISNAFI